jgi:hypothetical protein
MRSAASTTGIWTPSCAWPAAAASPRRRHRSTTPSTRSHRRSRVCLLHRTLPTRQMSIGASRIFVLASGKTATSSSGPCWSPSLPCLCLLCQHCQLRRRHHSSSSNSLQRWFRRQRCQLRRARLQLLLRHGRSRAVGCLVPCQDPRDGKFI